MPDDPYSLSDLARLADVTPRTVRYYVALGLLPSPEAAGPATRYGEGHLARLRLIRRLQRDHLPLAEIRSRLERMSDEEIIATVVGARCPGAGSVAGPRRHARVRPLADAAVRHPARRRRSQSHPGRCPAPGGDRRVARYGQASGRDWPAPERACLVRPSPGAPGPAESGSGSVAESGSASAPRPGPDRTTWERLVISPDVELHVRRPLDRTTNKRVDQLERIARELFEDH